LPGLLLAAPVLICVLAFVVLPVLYTVRLSMAESSGFKLQGFVGLANYVELFSDKRFLDTSGFPTGALITSLKWLVIAVPLVILVGFVVALAADRAKFQSLIRSAFFLPMVISGTVIGIIWLYVFAPSRSIGLLNAVTGGDRSWLGSPKTVNLSLMVAWIWARTGMSVTIIAAALKGVPAGLIDAGKIDGANSWQRFWHITFPSIRIPFSFLLVTQVVEVLKVFDVVYVMTKGGPAGLSRTLAVLFYEQTFAYLKPSYGAAVVVVMSLVIVAVYTVTRRAGRGGADG
jgi:ABC-type sugar transport system permease subunit